MVLNKIRGFLTKDDLKLLEEASKRQLKYKKNPAQKWKCGDCEYTWLYSASRCPVCSSLKATKC